MTKTDNFRQKKDFPPLSIEQENAVDLLVQGKSDREVGELVGVSRQTVTTWRNDNVVFVAALNARRQGLFGENIERLRWMLSKALDVIASGLESEDEKIRVQTAWNIVKVAGVENLTPTGKTTPDAIESERERESLFNFTF
jgi:hypothetical protein